MNSKRSCAPGPVQIARAALGNLTTQGLLPTPENYTVEYRKIAGGQAAPAPPSITDAPNAKVTRMMQGIIELVGATTADLSSSVDRFEVQAQPLLAQLETIEDKEAFACLARTFVLATLSLQETVGKSREELSATRRRLDEVTGELQLTEALARTDALTGFCNRRAMDEILARDVARAHRTRDAYSVAILDLDHFKKVNDEHGHAVGDQALLHLAFIAKSGVRETDAICRYGGEEFVILLPGSGAQGAHYVVDRLRIMVEKTPLVVGNRKVAIRFSGGVAALQAHEDAPSLLQRADQALYAAKRGGRNRVNIAASDPVAA